MRCCPGLQGVILSAAVALLASPVAADPEWHLSLGLQNPLLSRAEKASENTPQLVWNGRLAHIWRGLSFFSVGQYSTRDSLPWSAESKANIGMEYAINRHLDVYTFYESRFQIGLSRVVGGVRFNLGGKL